MKTLIQKEFRENLKVGLMGLAILILMLVSMFRNYEQPAMEGMTGPTLFFCAIFGALLGWLQAHKENNRDLWAFLIHRPMSRTEIFAAKVIAGILNAEVLEVHIFDATNAVVFARMKDNTMKDYIDVRWLELVSGQWLNTGNDGSGTLEQARSNVLRTVLHERALTEAERMLSSRAAMPKPASYLRPFVEFLQHEAADPKEFLLKALAEHPVLIVGEVHHRPRYWAFDAALVKASAFPKLAGVIYMELPSNDQALVDEFLQGPKYDPQPVIEMLRDNLWTGWPDQPMLDFFQTVWEVNQPLPKEQRLRLVLVDMERPWKKIHVRQDWQKYDVDRNQFMAANIVRDLKDHPRDSRHALFIVGWMHATGNLTEAGGDTIKSAAWHLRQALGETHVFAVFPHCPVMANMGGVNGRLASGLFDSAFAALANRPMAFPLDRSPFGELPFDAPSLDYVTTNSYRAAFDAYLYLGTLEDEIFSPLIRGFYTDEFVQELDRRCRLDNGQGLVATYGFSKLDAENFIHWMSTTWGQPRREWSLLQLGPIDAWQHGSTSVPKASWANAGYATPEASFQTMLWPAESGDLNSFVVCFPPDSKAGAGEFNELKSKVAATSAFSIVSKETNSAREVILNVALQVGERQFKNGFIMKELEGKWRSAGTVIP